MRVVLTYFKGTGKYQAQGVYETEIRRDGLISNVWAEVREKQANGTLPGLIAGAGGDYTILVEVPMHLFPEQRLIEPKEKPDHEFRA